MRVCAFIAFFFAFTPVLTAQTPAPSYVGIPVEDIQILIEGRPSLDPVLFDLLETRLGQPLSMVAVRDSIQHLHTLGRFQDIQVDATETPRGGVSLRFELTPVHQVRELEFVGNLSLSRGALRQIVTNRYGETPPVGRAVEIANELERAYYDRGYLRATVRATVDERHDPDRTILRFEIEAGPQARIGNVEVVGDPAATRESFIRAVRASEGQPYRRFELQQRLEQYVTRLKRRGFYQATADYQPTISEDSTSVSLTYTVRPGPAVTVRFEGDRVPADRLEELVPIEREGSVEEDLLEDSITALENYLRQQGYWKADAEWRLQEAPGTLTVVFTINQGRSYVVADPVEVSGNEAVSADELRGILTIKPGDLFVEAQLAAGSANIRDRYLKDGFAGVDVKAGQIELEPASDGGGRVRPLLTIKEGPRTIINAVRIAGNAALSEPELRGRIKSLEGTAFYLPQLAIDREALLLEYANNGFASAEVTLTPAFNADRSRADLAFTIREGPRTMVDHILIVGNVRTDPQVILNELRLRPGEPLGLEDQIASQRNLSALGLFRRVRITQLRHGSGLRHDVLVTVEEAPTTTIAYGGGLEANQRLREGASGDAEERLEFAPRGFFDIGRRNVGGRNRTVNLYTRVSLRPEDNVDEPGQDGTGFGFSEYRVVLTYRQPRALLGSDWTVIGAVEQGIRSSFNFARRGINAELGRRLTDTVRVIGRYTFSSTRTFDERLSEEDRTNIDRLFPQVRLSTFSGGLARDTRDDLVDPERGTFMSAEGNVAVRGLGGQVGFIKTYLQGFWFRRLPGPRRIVLASRGALGLADGFKREAIIDDEEVVIEDLPASERFFAGGDNSIRGFELDTVGHPDTIAANGFPRGGNATFIVNTELRIPVWGDFGSVLFVDGGNVWERTTDLNLGELRGAAGFGLRYRSPFGPIRLDLGFKLDRRAGERRTALHFSIGQAF